MKNIDIRRYSLDTEQKEFIGERELLGDVK